MKCKHCGKEVDEKTIFCPFCHNNTFDEQQYNLQNELSNKAEISGSEKEPDDRNKTNKKTLYLTLGILSGFIIIVFIIVTYGSPRKNSGSDAPTTTYNYNYNFDEETTVKNDYDSDYSDLENNSNDDNNITEPATEKHKIINDTSTDNFWTKGTGDYVAQGLKVKNYGVLHITHSGSENFIVKLYKNKEYENLLVNTIGNYTGDVLVDGSGEYELEIKADGNWNITSDGLTIDDKTSFSGKGDSVTGITSTGTGNWKITNNGSGNFIVKEYGVSSGYMDLLVNEIGSYSGVVKTTSSDDIFFAVKSDGDWTIEKE